MPTLVRAAAIGALAWAPLACGDDGNSSTQSNSSDQFPTDPCSHNSGTGGCSDSLSTNSESGLDSFPTTPCAHDPNSCESTGIDSATSTVGATDTGSATDTDTDTDTDGSGTASSGSSGSSGSGTGSTTAG